MASVENMSTPEYPIDSKDIGSESDIERGNGIVEVSPGYVVDKAMEKKMLWKFDLHILPMLAIMYLFK